MPRRLVVLAAALVTLALLPAAASAAPRLYVSLGDSYATGYQPTAPGVGGATRNGYADQLPPLLRKRGYGRLRLVNFGCGGATTRSLIEAGCAERARAVDGASYGGRTQLAAAERFLRRNRGRVALVTVSIGGNDVTTCAEDADPVGCVGRAVEEIKRNVRIAARRLRSAAGRRVPIVGLTYPDVILGLYTTGRQEDRDLAVASVAAFRQLINPALKSAYRSGKGRFIDVTRATKAYVPVEQTTDSPYGRVPVAVAEVCRISFFCDLRDIHLRTPGYRRIAELIARSLPRRG